MLSVLLGSDTAEKVLQYLLQREKAYSNEISKFYSISDSMTRKQLTKYEKANVVVVKQLANIKYYELNKRYPFYRELTLLLKRAFEAYPEELQKSLKDFDSRDRYRKSDKPLEYRDNK